MRAARLIHMVLLLQHRGAMTAGELAAELEISTRTVARDALALSEAGIPVYADRGRAGGYRLLGGYRTRLTGLGRDEAEALFLSGVPAALREMGLDDAASAARLKVAAALGPSLADAPGSAAQRFHLDAPGWWQEPAAPPLLPALARAVWSDRRIRAAYRRGDGQPVSRDLSPYGLVLKAGVWYLAAEAGRPGHRVYRVDRFTDLRLLEERFVRDAAFDLPAFWSEQAAAFARSILRTRIRLRLTGDGAARLRGVTDRSAAEEALAAADGPDTTGLRTVTLAVESEQVAFAQLLALGPEAEVLDPPGLRERFTRAAAQLHARYATRPPDGRGEPPAAP